MQTVFYKTYQNYYPSTGIAPVLYIKPGQLIDVLEKGLQETYWIQNELIKVLPEISKQARSFDLIIAVERYLEETVLQIVRLEEVFTSMYKSVQSKKYVPTEALFTELMTAVHKITSGALFDTTIILCLQKIAQIEMTMYRALKQYAKSLAFTKAAILLGETIMEESLRNTEFLKVAVNVAMVEKLLVSDKY
jgi:ferritin-like metal-binding protein YciE